MRVPPSFFMALPARVVLSVIFLVILTVTAVGLPAILQVRVELDRQSADRAASSAQVVRLLLEADQNSLAQATLLAASRPTLKSLLADPGVETAALIAYLDTLKQGMGVDALLLCGPGRAVAAETDGAASLYSAGVGQDGGVCQETQETLLLAGSPGRLEAAWLAAQRPVESLPEISGGWRILAGSRLDAGLTKELARQAGVELVLLIDGRPVTASLEDLLVQLPAEFAGITVLQVKGKGTATDNYRLYLQETHLPGLQILAALNLRDFEASRRQLTGRILLGMAAAALAGSILGVWAAGSITRPLEDLRRSAEGLRQGDLFTPVRTKSAVREIRQVAFALEEARAALQHSLDQLQQEKDWTAHLLDSIVEGIITLDRSGRVVFLSTGALRITGLREAQVVGHPLVDVLPASGLAELLDRAKHMEGDQAQPSRLTYRGPGNKDTERTLSVTTARLHIPGLGASDAGGLALVLRDVTEDERLHRLTGDFLANITHEFRTPLSALAAATELLLDQAAEENVSPGMGGMLDNLRLSILNLQTLIDNLLEGASIESGRFRVDPHPAVLDEIFQSINTTMRPLVEKYGQEIQVTIAAGTPEIIVVDPVRTKQALANLLSNAARFGPEGGQIKLQARPAADSRFVQISVSDQGVGLPNGADNSERLFQRFARLSNTEGRSEAGAGIGLSVVKAIVEAQGGQVGAVNNPSGGAVFWFTVRADENTGR